MYKTNILFSEQFFFLVEYMNKQTANLEILCEKFFRTVINFEFLPTRGAGIWPFSAV